MTVSRFLVLGSLLLTSSFANAVCGFVSGSLGAQMLELSAAVAYVQPTPVCPHGFRKTMSCLASNYGDGDGLDGNPVKCGVLVPEAYQHLDTQHQHTIALKRGIFSKGLCGKKVFITYKNERGQSFTQSAIITDRGNLAPGRCVDLTKALERDLHMRGTEKVKVQVCK